jgi:hypothetical protein
MAPSIPKKPQIEFGVKSKRKADENVTQRIGIRRGNSTVVRVWKVARIGIIAWELVIGTRISSWDVHALGGSSVFGGEKMKVERR